MTERAQTADTAVPADAQHVEPPDSQLPPAAVIPPAPAVPPLPALPPAASGNGVATSVSLPAAAGVPLELAVDAEADESTWREVVVQMPSWLASTVVHLLIVLLLALVTSTRMTTDFGAPTTVTTPGDGAGVEDLQAERMEIASDLDTSQALAPSAASEVPLASSLGEAIGPISATLGDGGLGPKSLGPATEDNGLPGAGGGGNSLELRLDGPGRAAMVRTGGGTPESEKAVALALEWLAEHQNYDGSWSFDHGKNPRCHGRCANEGSNASKIAATSLALLPFLGTGQTHREGHYKRTIDLGLKFLIRTIEMQRDGSLWDPAGTMYAHGLASIVLCEAYGMTHDQVLEAPAQAAVNFIVFAQDPLGGGWRYQPQTPGDTSVVGWQLMALKSAQMAYLRVPPATMRKAGYFLDHVQNDRGAVYGYQHPESRRPATRAIGLLCRMYLGWNQDHDALRRGVQMLGQLGPSTNKSKGMTNNMYYNYYATQVMHHFGGYPWQRWNSVMREYLIETQSTAGHEAGSWFLEGTDDGIHPGGRLYCTALAAMTLEVYYRYMPLYRPQVNQSE